jgi:hypothetical protein
VPAEITLEGFRSRIEEELATAATRVPGTRTAAGPHRLTSRRRRGDAHRIVAATLGVLALVGCVTAVLILAIQPTASRMQNDIAALTERLGATESQLSALTQMTTHTARQGSRLTQRLGLLDRHMTGLGRTLHGLQGSSDTTREESDGLRACFGALQRELTGLTLATRSAHGRLTNVGLSDAAAPAPGCGAAFSRG